VDARIYGGKSDIKRLNGYIDQNQNITSVCEGTGKKNDYEYYMERKRITGDFHGQAPVLWAASALLR
jgi:unsaturated rhamnogalacturonyl hydrolase